MIYLQVPTLEMTRADTALRTEYCDEFGLKFLRQCPAGRRKSSREFSEITKPIRGDASPVFRFDCESLDWKAEFSDIAHGTRRMLIAILEREFFGSNGSVLFDMFEDDSRTFVGNKLDRVRNIGWDFLLHRASIHDSSSEN